MLEKQRALINFLDKVKVLAKEKPLILAPFIVFVMVLVTTIVVRNFFKKTINQQRYQLRMLMKKMR